MSRIIIVGAGGSGKDTLKDRMIEKGYKREVSYTTRPKRDTETEGVDYHYITHDEFMKMVGENKFIQYKDFRGWMYGTHRFEWSTKNLFIMTPEGLEALSESDRAMSFVIYVDIEESIREARLRERNDADDVERRLNADREQFDGFIDYDLRITNPTF